MYIYIYIKLLVCDNDNMIWNWSRGIFCFVFVLILETINENFGPSKKKINMLLTIPHPYWIQYLPLTIGRWENESCYLFIIIIPVVHESFKFDDILNHPYKTIFDLFAKWLSLNNEKVCWRKLHKLICFGFEIISN